MIPRPFREATGVCTSVRTATSMPGPSKAKQRAHAEIDDADAKENSSRWPSDSPSTRTGLRLIAALAALQQCVLARHVVALRPSLRAALFRYIKDEA